LQPDFESDGVFFDVGVLEPGLGYKPLKLAASVSTPEEHKAKCHLGEDRAQPAQPELVHHLIDGFLGGIAAPGEFARWAFLTTGGVTVALDRLEKAGYIQREPNPQDRRSSIIRPLPAKFRKLHALYQAKGQALMGVLSAYNESELKMILDFFSRVDSGNAE
jgi:DNA-binding MarR family transcriptional regulator